MRTNFTHFVAAEMRWKLCVFAAAIALFPAVGWSQEYTVTDLGTLGGTFSLATSVNNKGQVAGQSTTATQTQADNQSDPFLYSNGKMIDLGNFGGDSGSNDGYYFSGNIANGVNDDGVVAGMAFSADGYPHPFLWSAGTLQDLAPGQVGEAFGINASNVAAGIIGLGYSWGGFNGYGAQFNSVGNFEAVPAPSPVWVSSPTAINNAGQIVGTCSHDEDTYVKGCLATGTTANVLLPWNSYPISLAYAINASGSTCGDSQDYHGHNAATAWISGTPVNLGWPVNTKSSECNGMDDFGQYVGNANTFAINQIGAIFDPVNGARDLNKLIPKFVKKGHGFTIQNAVSLSNTGFIAANCLLENGQTHACLLTPNPTIKLLNSIVAFAQGDPECISCEDELVPEAKSLPESLDGLSGDKRERVISTVKLIGEQIERLERERKISASKAILLLHQAELVLAAVEPKPRG